MTAKELVMDMPSLDFQNSFYQLPKYFQGFLHGQFLSFSQHYQLETTLKKKKKKPTPKITPNGRILTTSVLLFHSLSRSAQLVFHPDTPISLGLQHVFCGLNLLKFEVWVRSVVHIYCCPTQHRKANIRTLIL